MCRCRECSQEWKFVTEQAACIDLFGRCIVCTGGALTTKDLRLIMDEAAMRGVYQKREVGALVDARQ